MKRTLVYSVRIKQECRVSPSLVSSDNGNSWNFSLLCANTSANDSKRAMSLDSGLWNKLQWGHEFANMNSENNDDRLYTYMCLYIFGVMSTTVIFESCKAYLTQMKAEILVM